MDAPPPADMALPTEEENSSTATTTDAVSSSRYVCLNDVVPVEAPPDNPPAQHSDVIPVLIPGRGVLEESVYAFLAPKRKALLAADVAHIESLVREEAERRSAAPAQSTNAAVKHDALQSYFEHKPSFVLPSDFFSGLPPVVLKRYCDKVKKATNTEYLIRSSLVDLANNGIQLRLVAPAHCGFKEYTGETTAHDNSLVRWEAAAGALVEKLRNAHGWAPLAFNLSVAE